MAVDSRQREGTVPDDAWVDQLEFLPESRSRRVRVTETFTGPLRWVRRVILFALTTPGKIIAMMVVLTLALVAAGVSMSQSMASRQESMDVLVNSTEPMSNSAHQLITALSQADTLATTTFVQPGISTEYDTNRFAASVDAAVVAANDVLEGTVDSGARDGEIRRLVLQVQRDIPVYAGLMERARTNQRTGNPVSVAYMSAASDVMRERLLANSVELFDVTRQQVADEMERLSRPQWVPLSGLVAALVFLVAAQYGLWRVYRRRLNKGFAMATAMMVVAIAWTSAANYTMWESGQRDFERAAMPWEELTDARIDAQETRTNEIFALLRRQSATETNASFAPTHESVTRALEAASGSTDEEVVASARDALAQWRRAHAELVRTLGDGQFTHAVDVLTSTDPDESVPSSARAYSQLDNALDNLINQSREDMRAFIEASLDATTAVAGAVLVLTALSVLAIWLGIRQRLGEYL
ncbi:hypothetical protein [Corynebacterium liangguodongii]|uniref:Uncharacterized protein n=1 Tax=Corynebacterium liangguodongii TaxID=2079535 RepID=A0A2S0WG07_9CORY|nr:hypothetical protein [Corynebacterium liangguodongii]AWB84699.1 hypothetical protein C3E79_09630 [Corynebacterium liangguodongii]PWB99707.1 hypothetical protein DF219_05410 [Corynebacterium liangguodongii]